MLPGVRRRDAVAVVRDDHEQRQLLALARAPHQRGREIAFGGAGVAALHDGDALRAGARPLRARGADRDRVLHLDRRGDRDDVPLADREVPREVATLGVGIGRHVLHLAKRVDRIRPHREQGPARPIVEVEVVVVDALALVDEQAERHVEGLFAGAADPEVAVTLLVHGDQALLEDARPEHQVVDSDARLGGQPGGRCRNGHRDGRWTAGAHCAGTSYLKPPPAALPVHAPDRLAKAPLCFTYAPGHGGAAS